MFTSLEIFELYLYTINFLKTKFIRSLDGVYIPLWGTRDDDTRVLFVFNFLKVI